MNFFEKILDKIFDRPPTIKENDLIMAKTEVSEEDLPEKEKQFKNLIYFYLKNGTTISAWFDNWKPLETPFEHPIYAWSRVLEWYFSYESDWIDNVEVDDENSIFNDPYVTYQAYLYRNESGGVLLNRNEIVNFEITIEESRKLTHY